MAIGVFPLLLRPCHEPAEDERPQEGSLVVLVQSLPTSGHVREAIPESSSCQPSHRLTPDTPLSPAETAKTACTRERARPVQSVMNLCEKQWWCFTH